MPEKSLEEILRESLARGYCSEVNKTKVLDPDLIESMVKESTQSIEDYYLARLSRKKHSGRSKLERAEYIGYNQAIAEMKKAIEEG